MCTELEPGRIMVCDAAIGDVKEALAHDPLVSFTHIEFEGTLVQCPEPNPAFRQRIAQAIRQHGGAL